MELFGSRHELSVRCNCQEYCHCRIYYTQTQVFKRFVERRHMIIKNLEIDSFQNFSLRGQA